MTRCKAICFAARFFHPSSATRSFSNAFFSSRDTSRRAYCKIRPQQKDAVFAAVSKQGRICPLCLAIQSERERLPQKAAAM